MRPTFYLPHPALRPFVRHLLVVDVRLDGPAPGRFAPFPPTPHHCLNFYPGDATRSRQGTQEFIDLPPSVIVGPQTSRVDLALGVRHRFVSVALQPGGLFRLLRIPMHELRDQPLNAADLLGRELREVGEKLQAATEPRAMKDLVEAYLLRNLSLAPASPFEQAAKLMLGDNAAYSVDKVAALACLSNRQLERKANELLGYSPRFFARLIRFSRAYRLKVNQPHATWTTISHQCGYYDQMHLIRDFKEFTATTPRLLAREMQQAPLKIQGDQQH